MDAKILHEIFEYKDGSLFWKTHRQKVRAGERAGSIDKSTGRRRIKIDGKSYLEHRIIFAMFFGFFPEFIDHIDTNPLNNKIENLRQATRYQNSLNVGLRKTNTSGSKCVTWDNSQQKWRVRIPINGKRVHLGRFDDFELAELVAIEARNKYHGEFCRHA